MKISLTPVNILSLTKQEPVLYEDTWYTDFVLGRDDFINPTRTISNKQLKFTFEDSIFVENIGKNPIYLMKPDGFTKITGKTLLLNGYGIYIDPICFKVMLKREIAPNPSPLDDDTEKSLQDAILDDSDDDQVKQDHSTIHMDVTTPPPKEVSKQKTPPIEYSSTLQMDESIHLNHSLAFENVSDSHLASQSVPILMETLVGYLKNVFNVDMYLKDDPIYQRVKNTHPNIHFVKDLPKGASLRVHECTRTFYGAPNAKKMYKTATVSKTYPVDQTIYVLYPNRNPKKSDYIKDEQEALYLLKTSYQNILNEFDKMISE